MVRRGELAFNSNGELVAVDSNGNEIVLATNEQEIRTELGVPIYSDPTQAPQAEGRIIYVDGNGTPSKGLYQHDGSSYSPVGNWQETGSGEITPIDGETIGDGTTSAKHQSVSTDDIPASSWEKWAAKNLGFLNDGIFRSWQWGSLDRSDTVTGDATISTTRGTLKLDTGSGSGSGSLAKIKSIIAGSSDSPFQLNFDTHTIIYGSPVRVVDGADNHISYYTIGDGSVRGGNRGMGFKIASGELQGVIHDGTSETTTTLIASGSYSAGTNEDYIAESDPNDGEVRFYVDGTQQGSISSTPGNAFISLAAEVAVENTTDSQHRTWATSGRLGVKP